MFLVVLVVLCHCCEHGTKQPKDLGGVARGPGNANHTHQHDAPPSMTNANAINKLTLTNANTINQDDMNYTRATTTHTRRQHKMARTPLARLRERGRKRPNNDENQALTQRAQTAQGVQGWRRGGVIKGAKGQHPGGRRCNRHCINLHHTTLRCLTPTIN